jgi:hypothetical protein
MITRLAEHKLALLSIAEVPRSLEQVYLHIVREQAGDEHRTLEEEVAEWREGKAAQVQDYAQGPAPSSAANRSTSASSRKEVAS